jgi:benzoyl-CoA-dihydrodiol lyase
MVTNHGMINFQTSPDHYKHWKLSFEGPVARLTMDVQEDETLNDGYKLKLNSYDLGVDIELGRCHSADSFRAS